MHVAVSVAVFSAHDSDGQRQSQGYIPSAVFEGEAGHAPMLGNGAFAQPWFWGHTREEAERTCAKANERLGHTPEDVARIVASSMRPAEYEAVHVA